jgi:hypothetical protein
MGEVIQPRGGWERTHRRRVSSPRQSSGATHSDLRFRGLALPLLLGATLIGSVVTLAFVTSPFAPYDTFRHYMTVPNCDAARAWGLAPSRRGEPGYWPKHDADRDGIACEVWRGR